MNKRNEYDPKDRLIDYSVRIILLSEALPDSKAGKHIASQILRSGTSPAPNDGEATSAESPADFIHKLKVALKELRETEVWLTVIEKAGMIKPPSNWMSPPSARMDRFSPIMKSGRHLRKGAM